MDRFLHVTDWVFDLDNTLYPSEHDLFAQVDQRMTAFIAETLALDAVEARRLQKLYLRDYGTTLAGLMARHQMSPDAFLDFVHDIDVSVLPPDPDLAGAIDRLPGRKFIFTNGTRAHAERVAGQLGILHLFDDIFDIVSANYVPKPHPDIYPNMLDQFSLKADTTAFFEDLARNLAPAHALGMTTILIDPTGSGGSLPHVDTGVQPTNPSEDPLAVAGTHYIHHSTADLRSFLEQIDMHIADLRRKVAGEVAEEAVGDAESASTR